MEGLVDYEAVMQIGEPFTDQDFPPNLGSVFDPEDHAANANINIYTNIEFMRASEIFEEGEYVIFPENAQIQSSDIIQGSIGDCYFLSCLSALAAKPERIYKLFRTKQINKAGIYVLNLCINGTW